MDGVGRRGERDEASLTRMLGQAERQQEHGPEAGQLGTRAGLSGGRGTPKRRDGEREDHEPQQHELAVAGHHVVTEKLRVESRGQPHARPVGPLQDEEAHGGGAGRGPPDDEQAAAPAYREPRRPQDDEEEHSPHQEDGTDVGAPTKGGVDGGDGRVVGG